MLINAVAPFAGAWIEIFGFLPSISFRNVAPFAGAWIEIFPQLLTSKFGEVAPFAGAWIEIGCGKRICRVGAVAPFAGAWIEIPHVFLPLYLLPLSLPSRERGLKYPLVKQHMTVTSRSLRGSVD